MIIHNNVASRKKPIRMGNAQGEHLYAMGGERVTASSNAQNSDDEDDGECLAEVCQLDLESEMWMVLPMTGTETFT